MKKTLLLLILSILFVSSNLVSKNRAIDSLLIVLKADKEDTNKVIHLNKISRGLYDVLEYEKGLVYCKQSLELAQSIGFKKGEATALSSIGLGYSHLTNYPLALEYLNKSFDLNKALNNKKQMGGSLVNMGNIFSYQGKYSKAIEYYYNALKYLEEIKYKPWIANVLNNIGEVYGILGEYEKEKENYLKALKIFEELNDEQSMSMSLTNIGNSFRNQKDYTTALSYQLKAYESQKKAENKQHILDTETYFQMGNFQKSLEFCNIAIEQALKQKDKGYYATMLKSLARIYLKQNKYKEAIDYNNQAALIYIEIGEKSKLAVIEKNLSDIYEQKGETAKALEHYKKFISKRDSFFNEENSKKVMKAELNYEYEKKENFNKAEQEKIDLKNKEEKEQQKIIIFSVIGILAIVILFSGFIVNRFKVTKKQKLIIEDQKKLVDSAYETLHERNKEVMDSINYAERIQRSFLATKEQLDEQLKNYFVLFQPKDVVSGDFYWAHTLNNGNFALVTADSTGHGVPGAIMSLLNTSSLERAVELGITEPAEILNHTRKTIIERLKKDGSAEGGKDGMDCSLMSFNSNKSKLTYSAANNPIWIVRSVSSSGVENKKELIELIANKMPVGKHDRDTVSFTQQDVELQLGDMIYTLTDGFPDQFGGPKGKKFMYKKLKEILINISHLPMAEQNEYLKTTLNNWKGDLEQVDDVCLIGIRV